MLVRRGIGQCDVGSGEVGPRLDNAPEYREDGRSTCRGYCTG